MDIQSSDLSSTISPATAATTALWATTGTATTDDTATDTGVVICLAAVPSLAEPFLKAKITSSLLMSPPLDVPVG